MSKIVSDRPDRLLFRAFLNVQDWMNFDARAGAGAGGAAAAPSARAGVDDE